jgi:hypothetical protein
MDSNYRRLRYIRYADDFLLGFAGPRDEAEEIKTRIEAFLRDNLKLEMSPEKTLITHAATHKARFLGYDIGTINHAVKSPANGNIVLRLPPQKLETKIAKYTSNGSPIHRAELMTETDFSIVARYGSEYQGIVQYYALASNRYWLHRLQWVMSGSMLKTLAAKHNSTVAKMARKYQTGRQHRGQRMRCFEVKVERPGKKTLTARFGGLRLTPDPHWTIRDGRTDFDRFFNRRSEILARLMADKCELCESNEQVQVHHIRKLADLKSKGRAPRPTWMQVMSALRRKTLVVCAPCHRAIHAGRPTRTPSGNGGMP